MKKNNLGLTLFLVTLLIALTINLAIVNDAKADGGSAKYCYKSNPNHHCGERGNISCGLHKSSGNH